MIDHGVHLCGVRGPSDEQILFQRGDTETMPSDIHFEFQDQGSGGYDFVRACRLSRRVLSIDLTRPLRSFPEVMGIDVALDIDDQAFRTLSDGLAVVFAPCPERLVAA